MAKPKKDEDLLAEIAAAVADPDDPDAEADAFAEPEVEFGAPEGGEALAAQIEALKAERDELRDRFMRALADAENSRKRSERDRKEAENYGGSKLARDMLPVYDNMKRALEAATDEQRAAMGAVLEGVELTMRELLNVFKKHGIERVEPQVGERFDPQLHQAMFEAPVPGTKAGDIIQVMTEGFMLHDRLLRPAQVGVSSTPG
jgi:molecular chaperone GrpE